MRVPPPTATDPVGRDPSFARLLLVWVFVGFSLTGLFAGLLDALPDVLPLSTLGGGLLLGTAVFAALWVAGVRPSPAVASPSLSRVPSCSPASGRGCWTGSVDGIGRC